MGSCTHFLWLCGVVVQRGLPHAERQALVHAAQSHHRTREVFLSAEAPHWEPLETIFTHAHVVAPKVSMW